jgi:hypothetical protein
LVVETIRNAPYNFLPKQQSKVTVKSQKQPIYNHNENKSSIYKTGQMSQCPHLSSETILGIDSPQCILNAGSTILSLAGKFNPMRNKYCY